MTLVHDLESKYWKEKYMINRYYVLCKVQNAVECDTTTWLSWFFIFYLFYFIFYRKDKNMRLRFQFVFFTKLFLTDNNNEKKKAASS